MSVGINPHRRSILRGRLRWALTLIRGSTRSSMSYLLGFMHRHMGSLCHTSICHTSSPCLICGRSACDVHLQRALSKLIITDDILSDDRAHTALKVWSALSQSDPRWAHLCVAKERGTPEICASLVREVSSVIARDLTRSLLEQSSSNTSWTVCVIPPRLSNLRRRGVSPQHMFASELMSALRRQAQSRSGDQHKIALSLTYRPHLLRRVKKTPSQRNLSRVERHLAQRGSLRSMSRAGSPDQVLLIDDVITTGGTLRAGAEALYDAGVHRVIAVTMFKVERIK